MMNTQEIQVFDGSSSIDDICRNLAKTKQGRKNIDDAFYVFNLGQAAKTYILWKELFPRIKPFYAVKAAPHDPMISAMDEMGCGFDCASQSEINQAVRLGVQPEKIVMSNPCKQVSHVVSARDVGVKWMVFDNETELKKMKKYYPESELVLRISTELSGNENFSLKFGASFELSRELILKAKNMNLNIVGISFHIGEGPLDLTIYPRALNDAGKLFDYAESLGFSFTLLDIGGGFRADDIQLREVAVSINDSVEKLFPKEKYPNLAIISEPGAFFASKPYTLAMNVIAKKQPANSTVQFEYFVNDGKFGSFLLMAKQKEEEKQGIFLELKYSGKSTYKSRIWGPVLTVDDKIVDEIDLPELEIEDWIFWKDSGAYSFGACTNFNGFKTTAFYNVVSAEDKILFEKQREKSTPTYFTFISMGQ